MKTLILRWENMGMRFGTSLELLDDDEPKAAAVEYTRIINEERRCKSPFKLISHHIQIQNCKG